MEKHTEILVKQIEDKSIIWFANTNQYVILESQAAKILQDLNAKKTTEFVAKKLAKELALDLSDILSIVLNIEQNLLKPNIKNEKEESIDLPIEEGKTYQYSKLYSINNKLLLVDYETEEHLYFVHPKFAHLEVEKNKNPDYHFEVFNENKKTFLLVDKITIGSWQREDIHFFQGKFSMKIVEKIHKKEEQEWMGVFHASAIGNEKNSMLFLGDSGNGKSTSLALLQANGFTCLADDFVPVSSQNKHVYSFPSAISIKKNSLKTLIPIYPELESSAEYNFKTLNKIVRYLPPKNDDYKSNLPCKALIFIKYEAESDLKIKQISNITAFEKLVPDSWLSPKKENADIFLNWFINLPCYEIIYDNNDKMIQSVKKIFKDEL